MRRTARLLWRTALALAVAGVLGFGSYEAYASSGVMRDHCNPLLGPGHCVNRDHCQDLCDTAWGPGFIGECRDDGCCLCWQ
jgi:hypothetical protein